MTEEIQESSSTITFDLSSWKMKDKNAFMKTANAAARTGDEEEVFPFMAKLIKAWPYAFDPADPKSYGELTIDQWLDLNNQLRTAIEARFQGSK